QHAHVGRIDVLIGRERHAVAVLATVRLVRQAADGEEVVRGEQSQRVVAGQALGALDLLGDGLESRVSGGHAGQNAERGTRNAEQKWRVVRSTTLTSLFRVPRSDFRV